MENDITSGITRNLRKSLFDDNDRACIADLPEQEQDKIVEQTVKHRLEERVAPIYVILETLINEMSGMTSKVLANMLACKLHQTLLQSFMRDLIVPFARKVVELDDRGCIDLRAQATAKICRDIVKSADTHGLPLV